MSTSATPALKGRRPGRLATKVAARMAARKVGYQPKYSPITNAAVTLKPRRSMACSSARAAGRGSIVPAAAGTALSQVAKVGDRLDPQVPDRVQQRVVAGEDED